jgi:hypothetical protein
MIGDYSIISNKSGETRRLQRIAADVVSELASLFARTRRSHVMNHLQRPLEWHLL